MHYVEEMRSPGTGRDKWDGTSIARPGTGLHTWSRLLCLPLLLRLLIISNSCRQLLWWKKKMKAIFSINEKKTYFWIVVVCATPTLTFPSPKKTNVKRPKITHIHIFLTQKNGKVALYKFVAAILLCFPPFKHSLISKLFPWKIVKGTMLVLEGNKNYFATIYFRPQKKYKLISFYEEKNKLCY